MSNDQGPTGQHGRPHSYSWSVAAIIFGAGYGLGYVSTTTALAIGFLLLLGQPLMEVCWVPAFGCFVPFYPWLYVKHTPALRTELAARLALQAISRSYTFCVGIACGWIAGVSCSVTWTVLDFPLDSLSLGIPVLIPLPGLWWVARRRRRPTDSDYDDKMTVLSRDLPRVIDLPDLAATEAFGRRLGALLFPNAVVALVGPLGAGKTYLTRAVAEGLGIANPAAVTSPTFTLVHEYPARLPIYHFDAYRLNGPNEFLDLGVSEYYEAGGVCLIEWADKVESALPTERLTIHITPVDENRRQVEVAGVGERYEAIVHALASGAA